MDFWGAGWSLRFGVDIGLGRGYAETSVWGTRQGMAGSVVSEGCLLRQLCEGPWEPEHVPTLSFPLPSSSLLLGDVQGDPGVRGAAGWPD